MANDDGALTGTIKKLKGPENYAAWLIDVNLTLKMLEVYEYVTGQKNGPIAPHFVMLETV